MSWTRVFNINILLLSLVILIIELIYGGWLYPEQKNNCNYVLCSAKVTWESGITSGKVTSYTKDKFGLRNRNEINSDIDLLVIGGSTSDQRYVNDNKTWDHLLQGMFKRDGNNIDIVNAGIDGQSTVGHIWNFKEWFPYIPNFSPKYILFYVGLNDIPPLENTANYDNVVVGGWKQVIKQNSVLYRIYREFNYRSNNYLTKKTKAGHGDNSTNLNYIDKFNYEKNSWELYKELLIKNKLIVNLDSLVKLTRELGSEPIFVTQKTARWILKDNVIFGSGVYSADYYFKGSLFKMSNSDFGYAEKIVSESIMEFCNSNNLHCINGFNKFEFNKQNTYDLIHTNIHGSEEISKKLYPELKKLF
ncbi:SGNH/GDSL hydrolase family protein [Candidatus Thioglobus sp.]|nr:SGNH/GDSL hydrolase family protein [Candidatus Thioglobus sp.]